MIRMLQIRSIYASVQIQCHRTNRKQKQRPKKIHSPHLGLGPGEHRTPTQTIVTEMMVNVMVTKHKLFSKVKPLYIANVMLKNIQSTHNNSNLLGKSKKARAIKEYRAMDHGKVKG